MPPPDAPLARAADLGLKLVSGAEVLCARAALQQPQGSTDRPPQQQQDADSAAAEAPSSAGPSGRGTPPAPTAGEAAVASEPGWQAYKASLESNGWFRSNLPGSARYTWGGLLALLVVRVLGCCSTGRLRASPGHVPPATCAAPSAVCV